MVKTRDLLRTPMELTADGLLEKNIQSVQAAITHPTEMLFLEQTFPTLQRQGIRLYQRISALMFCCH